MIKLLHRWPNYPFRLNRQSPQARDLVGWWPMLGQSQRTDVLSNYSDYRIDGSWPGGTANPAWGTDGEKGRYLDFDGTNDTISIAHNALWNFDHTDSFTIAFSVRIPSGSEVDGDLVTKWHNSPLRISFRTFIENNGTISGNLYDGTNERKSNYTASDIRGDGKWHSIIFRNNGSACELFVDGVSAGANSTALTVSSTVTQSVYIGSGRGAQNFAEVDIADVRIYNVSFGNGTVQHLVRNPWDLYAPVTPRIWVVGAPAAVGGITIPVLMRSYRQRRV